ncbi:hypothetical protein BpHYR1_007105, partial [Brachionus plicatilis]
SFRGLPERLRSETVPVSSYRFLVEEAHYGDTPNNLAILQSEELEKLIIKRKFFHDKYLKVDFIFMSSVIYQILNLSTDGWISPANNCMKKKFAIDLFLFHHRQEGLHVCDSLIKALKNYGLDEKVLDITTDNVRNMANGINYFKSIFSNFQIKI